MQGNSSLIPAPVAQDRFIREQECLMLSGMSRTTRWRAEKIGEFPKRRRIGKGGVGWLLSEVLTWQEDCKRLTAGKIKEGQDQ